MWFLPIFIDFSLFSFVFYFIYIFHLNPKVLTTLQVFDFLQIENPRSETLEQGSTFLVCFCEFVACTDSF
jgi:hypothetical protein